MGARPRIPPFRGGPLPPVRRIWGRTPMPGAGRGGILSSMTDTGATEDGRQPEALWWVRGITLAERLPFTGQLPSATGDLTKQWRADYAHPAQFAARLADLGLPEDGLRALLAEPPEALAGRL